MDLVSTTVSLNVYDISYGYAKRFAKPIQFLLGLSFDGIWHTGIVFRGTEYFFGEGILFGIPEETPFGIPEKRLELGTTEIGETDFQAYLLNIDDQFQAHHYHSLKYNCNVFTNSAALFLTGTAIPSDILLQPQFFLNSPLIKSIKSSYQLLKASVYTVFLTFSKVLSSGYNFIKKLNFPMNKFCVNKKLLNLESLFANNKITYGEFILRKKELSFPINQ